MFVKYNITGALILYNVVIYEHIPYLFEIWFNTVFNFLVVKRV